MLYGIEKYYHKAIEDMSLLYSWKNNGDENFIERLIELEIAEDDLEGYGLREDMYSEANRIIRKLYEDINQLTTYMKDHEYPLPDGFDTCDILPF